MGELPLSHLTVVDLSQNIAGPYCTKLMAEYGATVIKIENPGTGDRMRTLGPFFQDQEGIERSIPFLWLNMGKKSVTLDLEGPKGNELLERLLGRADAMVDSFSPRRRQQLGLSYAGLQEKHPGLVMVSVSNFGQSGPYSDYEAEEIVEYATGGLMYLTGKPDREPLGSGPAVSQYAAGMNAYIATLMALYQKEASGQGSQVEVSVQESAIDLIEVAMVEYLHKGNVAKRKGNDHTLVPWQLYPCRDGYAAVIGGPIRHWLKAADLFEEPRLLDDKYQHITDRIRHRVEVRGFLQPWLSRNSKKEVFETGRARDLAFSYLADLDEVMDYPQHRARGYFVAIDHPEVGSHLYCGPPFRSNAFVPRAARAPLLGEHNREVYGEILQFSEEGIEQLREEGVI
jgi:crotonobetainyl-CoA:carnitine CoA-transferase CaiB-like acyl-CoA transferase